MTYKTALSLKVKLALVITIVLWASAFVGIRAGLEGYSPGALALFRFIVASVCMLFIFLRLPSRVKITLRDKIGLIALGGVTLGCYHIALNYGELTVPSGTASFIVSQMPIITTILAIFFLRERLNFLGVTGMAISFVGMAMIMLGQDGRLTLDVGVLYVFIAAIAGSVYTVLQKPFLKKYHVIEVTGYVIWGSVIPMLIYIPELSHEVVTASWGATLSVIYLGIFPAAIAYLGWSYVLAAMPASRAANFMYFMPVIATFLGWICLGEVLASLTLVGGIIALFGVWVVNESHRKMGGVVVVGKKCVVDLIK